jgi:hypothetical protein
VCRACGVAIPSELLLPEEQIRHFEEQSERERKADREADSNVNTEMPNIPSDL